MAKRIALLLVGLVFAAWVALTFTSHGLLVGSALREPASPGTQATLQCTYFTGLGIVTLSYWHSADGSMGQANCPRLRDFRLTP